MTAAIYDPSSNGTLAPTAADQSSKGAARIVQWAQSAAAAHDLAVALCETSFCPEQFRNKPGEATAAILAGGEVGLSPLAALQAFDIIQGRAAARAITLRAVVLSFGHEIELLESSEQRCVMRGRRKGSQNWQTVTWTYDRAVKLKLTSKQNWQTQRATMLVARTTSEICRLIAADAILGIGYAAEELEDMVAEEQGKPVKVRRQAAALAAKSEPTPTTAEDDELLGKGQVAEPDPVTGEVQTEPTGYADPNAPLGPEPPGWGGEPGAEPGQVKP